MQNIVQNPSQGNSPSELAVLQKLKQGPKQYFLKKEGEGWHSQCPLHPGHPRALLIDFKEGKPLFTCITKKCSQADIEKKLGLGEEQPQVTVQKPPQDPAQDNTPKKEPSPERPLSSPAAPPKDVSVLTFIKNLQGEPAYLKVEPQEKGGWLVKCPGCSAYHQEGLALGVNQIGPEIVVRCAAGCTDDGLVGALLIPGNHTPVITAHQWIEREATQGHERTYLQERIARLLPLPPELRPSTIPKARSFDEFMELKPAPRESLCGQWFRTGGLVMVSGDSGAGKTWFSLNLALSVSTGVDFMRWSVPKARKVLLVSGEDDIEDLQQRGRSLLKGSTKKPLLTFLNANDLARLPGGIPNLGSPEGRALIEGNLDGVELVIFDNYSTLFNGVDENDAKEFAPIQEWLFWFKARGIAILLVSHTGKNGDHRGSSKKVDGLNATILLNHPANWKASDGASFNLQFKKSRDARGVEVESFSARLGEDEQGSLCWLFGEVQSSPVTRPSPKTDHILELHSQGRTPKEIMDAGYKKAMVYAVLASLKESTPKDAGVSPVQSGLVPPKGGVTRLDSGRTKEPKSSLVQSSPVTRLDSKQARTGEQKKGAPPGA